MTEKEQEYINDITEHGQYSNCCDANIILGDICTECLEHCDPISEQDD